MNETLELEKYIINPSKNIEALFNHLGRYYYAAKMIDVNKNDTVLDISCGQGYGSYYLSTLSKMTYGSDINNDNILKAKELFRNKNLEYLDNGGMPKRVDKIICIETIEHIEKNNIYYFIKKLFSILEDNGDYFFTFPVGKNEPSAYNEYHKCEPSIEFIDEIIKEFSDVYNNRISKYINNYGYETEYCYLWGIK